MNLIVSRSFHKDLLKLSAKNAKLQKQISKTLGLLTTAPTHPSLRLHKLSNRGDYSVSVNMSIRITLRFVGEDVYLLQIGTHEQVY